jgi:hypothetical protein
MHQHCHRRSAVGLLLAALAVLLLAACSSIGSATPAPASTSLAARPASTAKLTILAPRNGQTLSRRSSEVRLGLRGARIVSQTTTRIRPDQGHIHLLVDGKLVAMNYGLNERLPALPPASTWSRSSTSPPTTPRSNPGSSPRRPSPSGHRRHPVVGSTLSLWACATAYSSPDAYQRRRRTVGRLVVAESVYCHAQEAGETPLDSCQVGYVGPGILAISAVK